MLSGLNILVARAQTRDRLEAAARSRSPEGDYTPVRCVTLRYSSPADADGLRRLAQLDSARPTSGATLVAVVDGRLRAALPLDGGTAPADPFHRSAELIELLRLRAAQQRTA